MFVRLQTIWWELRDRDTGATMPEYGLMVALVAAVALAGATALGIDVRDKFQAIADVISGAGGGAGA